MEDEKRVAELLEGINEKLEQLKDRVEENPENVKAAVSSEREGSRPITLSVIESIGASVVSDLRELGDDGIADELERKFAEIPDHFYREMYKDIRRTMELGGYKNEAAFLEYVKEKGLESYAVEDGYDLDNPSEETLPQWAELHVPKTLEENAFEAEKLAHELNGMLIGDRILGPVGSAIGGAIGSFFGFFAGAAESAEIKRLS